MERIVEIPDCIKSKEKADPFSLDYGWPVREEIVRCRDCGYSNDDPSCTHPRWRRGQHDVVVYPPVEPDGFCWLGERRG